MSLIDPMHNLFLGTARHVFNLRKNNIVIDNKILDEIDEKLPGIQAATMSESCSQSLLLH